MARPLVLIRRVLEYRESPSLSPFSQFDDELSAHVVNPALSCPKGIRTVCVLPRSCSVSLGWHPINVTKSPSGSGQSQVR